MSRPDAVADLARGVRGRVERDVVLAARTTYRLGGAADVYVEVEDVDDLAAVARFLAEHPGVPALPLGRGSNLVVSDHGYPGVVVHLGDDLATIKPTHDERVVAGGAAPLPQLANWAARRGMAGVEFGVGVPGSVGGAVRMNAGAHGQDFASVTAAVEVFELRTGRLASRRPADCSFAYRRSGLTDDEIVVSALLELREDAPERVRRTLAEFREHRARTQPGVAQNAGSVFKNPPGDFAARLVEQAGLKGYRIGGAQVSEKHANFFIAHLGARAQDVFDLVQQVGHRVADRFGVVLEPEVRFVGEFAISSREAT